MTLTDTTEETSTTEPGRPIGRVFLKPEKDLRNERGAQTGLEAWDLFEEFPGAPVRSGQVAIYVHPEHGVPDRLLMDEAGTSRPIVPLSRTRTNLEEFDPEAPMDTRELARLIASTGYSNAGAYAQDVMKVVDSFLAGELHLSQIFGHANRREAIEAGIRAAHETRGISARSRLATQWRMYTNQAWERSLNFADHVLKSNRPPIDEQERFDYLGLGGAGSSSDMARWCQRDERLRDLIERWMPLAPPEIPDEVATMSEQQVKEELVRLNRKVDRTVEALWAEADRRDMCGEFDNVMRRVGWPPRPQEYNFSLRVAKRTYVDENHLRRLFGQVTSTEGELSVHVSISHGFTRRLREEPKPVVTETGSKREMPAEEFLTSEERANVVQMYGGTDDDYDWSSATVSY